MVVVVWYPAITMIVFTKWRNTGSTKKKKSASRTIHFQFSNSFYFSIVIYTELNVQNSLPIVFYTFPSSPKEITIFLILFTSNVTLHTRRILYFWRMNNSTFFIFKIVIIHNERYSKIPLIIEFAPKDGELFEKTWRTARITYFQNDYQKLLRAKRVKLARSHPSIFLLRAAVPR